MKQMVAVVCCAMLTACVGDGNTNSTVTDIQGKGLNYAARAQFDFYGTYLDKGLSANVPNCTAQTPVFISPVHQALTCIVTAVGDINVEVRDGAGTLIFSRLFSVPAPRVAMVTSMGNITVELNPAAAPITVNNFLKYVQAAYYADTIFHRVIAGFVIQGGGYAAGLTAKPDAFDPITLESNNGLSNLRGTMAMARTAEPDSARSQFFFNLADNLTGDYKDAANPGYAVFGKIVQGLDVMDAIGAVPTATRNQFADVPVTDVVLSTALRIQ